MFSRMELNVNINIPYNTPILPFFEAWQSHKYESEY